MNELAKQNRELKAENDRLASKCEDLKRYQRLNNLNSTSVCGEAIADAMHVHFLNAGSYNSWNNNDDAATTATATTYFRVNILRPADSMEVESLIRKLKLNVTAGIDDIIRPR